MTRITGYRIAVLAALAALAACTSTKSDIAYAPASFTAPGPAPVVLADAEYKFGPGDILTVKTFGMPEISGEYTVDSQGSFAFPLVGDVPAANRTPREIDFDLTRRLTQRYYRDIDLVVTLKESRSQKITVDGSVTEPGLYPVTSNQTLLQAIAMAKGPNDDANTKRVVIFRQIEGKRAAAAFDLNAIRAGTMDDPQVYSGDTIVVDGSKTRSVWRDIIKTVPVLAIFRFF